MTIYETKNLNFRELGSYSWHTVGLIDPAGTVRSHSDICQSILDNNTTDQRRICMRSQRVLTVCKSVYWQLSATKKKFNFILFQAISLGAKMGKEECQHHFRNNRWNCTSTSNVIYGGVLSISKSFVDSILKIGSQFI